MQKLTFQQKVVSGFIVTLLCVFALAFSSFFNIRDMRKDASWVDHTEEVLSGTDHLLANVIDVETTQRGYVITGDPVFLTSYYGYVKNTIPTLNRLKNLVGDNPQQVSRLETLGSLIAARIAITEKVVNANRLQGFAAARELMISNSGAALTDQIRSKVTEINSIEEKLLDARKKESTASAHRTYIIIIGGSMIVLIMVGILLFFIVGTFRLQKKIEAQLRHSNLEYDRISKENQQQNWILSGAVVIDASMRGTQLIDERTKSIITEIAKYVQADLGLIYLASDNYDLLTLSSTYAVPINKAKKTIQLDEGLIGQTITQKKGMLFSDIPPSYTKIGSGTGDTLPKSIYILPIFISGKLVAVIELAFIGDFDPNIATLLDKVLNNIGVAIQAAQARVMMIELMETTQQQAEELETQHEELRTTNDELVHKTRELQSSEEELRVQQEELRQINSELEEKAQLLEERNQAVNQAREAISMKAKELEQTSKYKSEFLANMSHELRTPLNSILILARILRDNKNANLNDDQVKYANVIHNAGSDLLTLINDILDLSKIESGKIDLSIEEVKIGEIKQDIELLFHEVANNKKVGFTYKVNSDVPERIVSDRVRLEQIIRNLLSNAFKFTSENGSVTVNVSLADKKYPFFSQNLINTDKSILAFSVTDTGIGIPLDKQKVIFEAFQQADGSTSRKYGGTGLGLSISRELAYLLGGEIGVESVPGEGSTFTLYLPVSYNEDQQEPVETGQATGLSNSGYSPVKPGIEAIPLPDEGKEHVLLIIEDDKNFAEVLKDYATERGFKPILAYQGDSGLEMAIKYRPDAIVLDIMLPVMDGWTVLKKLKDNADTRDIPVHLMSAGDERPVKAMQEGAIGFMKKPVDKEKLDEAFNLLVINGQLKLHKVLVIEDSEIQSENLRSQLSARQVEVRQAFKGSEAMWFLENETNFDCIILDLSLPDISGLDLLDKIKAEESLADIPVVINTAMELDQTSMERVMKHTHAMVLKNNKSNDRLLDEVNLFMNKIQTTNENKSVATGYNSTTAKPMLDNTTIDKALKNKTVLIVDDDMRNVFALTSALESYELQITIANTGIEALKKLDENPATDIVLMDIMMPEMDGYEAMQEIRKQNRFNKLPIIALTAKAMKNDREKCIAAGANDYISKPVDVEKLVSLMRVWLS